MDGKKVVQMASPAASLQVRRKSGGDGPGVAAAVSGVRRRSGPQGLRSPAAKRPLSAPVALQGWLHKQGSEGLMLWKKRWFVLSEYCLFYYKGPEEEKLLGSILLPSYRVTVCRPEDKITRKFAFRAEHANMRTYHFAADSRESMNQWVNALTLATLLQDPNPAGADAAIALDIAGPADGERSARPSVSSISSILNQSADDSDSGFHGFQSRDDPSHASNNNSSPNSINTVSFPNLTSNNNGPGNVSNNGHDSQSQQQPIVNGWMQQPSAQYAQPGPSQQQYQQNAQNQQNHSHQHQALLHQHYQHATQHKHAITQQQPGPSNQVQTVQPMARNFGQSLYVNAPPKPKRLTNDGANEYSTPSPDPDYRKSPVSPDARLSSKSPMSEYDRNSLIYGTRVTQPPQQSLRTDKSGLNYGYSQPQNTERRTPDTYGRSIKPRNARGNGDYEDVYAGGPQLYQRPAGPVGYTKGQAPAPIPIPVYTQQHQQQIYSTAPPVSAIMRQHRAHPPPRPHSADFLEYEATRRPQQQTLQQPGANHPNQQRRPQRPKSSLDIVNPSEVSASDGYFYSEERYAAQMRQSAVYIHQTPQHHQQQRNQSLSRATTPSKSSSNRDRDHDPNENSCNIPRHHQRELHQQHIISSQPLQRHTEISNEALLRRSLRERSYEPSARELLVHGEVGTVPRRISREYEAPNGPNSKILALGNQGTHLPHMSPSGHAATRRWSEQQFARSASARLPRTRHPAAMDREDDDCTERSSGQDSRDGERKIQQREESMKRLLEWKQRMLQSPLTRKPSGSANRGTAHNELSSYYKQQALLDLAAHEASVAEARHCRRREEGHRVHVRSKSTDGRRSVTNVSRYNSYSSDDEASGSGSVIGRDPLPPRAVSTSQLPQRASTQPPSGVSTLPLPRTTRQQPLPVQQSTPQTRGCERTGVVNEMLRVASSGDVRTGSPGTTLDSTGNHRTEGRKASPGVGQPAQRLSSPALRVVSPSEHRMSSPSDSERHINGERKAASPTGRDGGGAGMLRQNQRSNTRDAGELSSKRARLAELDTPRRLENLQKLEELKKHLMDLEKQYEKGKPLVNLVDNMVKLGSLYNRGNQSNGNGSVSGSRQDLLQAQEQNKSAREHRDRLEFNQRVQEQRLLAEERRDWDRLSPDHGQLQAKVQQLYKLDRLLQEESGTLHSLQQDKEILEKALGGLRHKLQGSRSNPAEVERYRKQQLLLERELSRVRLLLAHNSKKLEETVAENARLEQDLVVLRQKLQASRRYAGNMSRDPSGTTAALEAELRRVQQLVGDLQRQRQELSIQVRQLTEKSHSLVQQIRPQAAPAPQVHHSKKRSQSSWLETDLDSGMTLDHGLDSPSSPALSTSPRARQNGSPHQVHLPSPQYKDPPTPYKENSHLNHHSNNSHYGHLVQQNQQFAQAHSPQNHISSLSPQLREQIQQHQLKQQQLRDQIQGKSSSPIQKSVTPLYINTDPRRQPGDGMKGSDPILNGPVPPPEYVPPPPPPPSEEALMNGGYNQNDENKFMGMMQNREKQEIKTVRIVKRESERRQRDRGDRTGNIGIPLTNGLPAPGGAKRLGEDEFGGSQQFEKAQLGRVVEESPMMHAQSTVQLSELDDVQFQRSMSLPRGFGGQRSQPGIQQGPVPPPPRSDSMNALRNMMVRRHRVRFESHDASSDSTLSPYTDSPTSSSQLPMSSPNYSTSPSYSPSHQNYLAQCARVPNQQTPSQYYPHPGSYPAMRNERHLSAGSPGATSPNPISAQERLFGSAASITSLSESPQLSPVFKSEAAKQIIKEMTEKKSETSIRRRQIPKEKRRHYTVSSSKPVFDLEDTFSKMGMGRARDDLDMERALRPRINAPDVVRSTLSHKELKYNESTIDQLLGTPNKIFIPERYIPEQTPELSAEEKQQRLKKAESIRKMLSETTVTAPGGPEDEANLERSDKLKRKVAEEKRQREHILQLNQILAKQVMEKSKMVAVQALTTLHLNPELSFEDEDLSPVTPLPLYQQRENYYS